MSQALTFRVGSFDLTKFSEGELWARMGQLARFYAALGSDFRLLAHSRPYPLDEPLERIKALMAAAQDPRARAQIAAYRRFLEQVIDAAYLKDAEYYLVLFAERDQPPQAVANSLSAGLRLPVWPARLPALIQATYQEAPAHIEPLRPGLPHLALLYSYDLRGQLSFGTVVAFLQLACPLSLAIDVRTVPPGKAVRTLQLAHNKLKAELLGRGGNEAPDPEVEGAYRDVQEALQAVQHERHGLHQVVLAVAVEGRSRDELERHVEMVTSTAARNQVYLRPAWLHQFEALRLFTASRATESVAREARNLLSPGVALLSPFGYEVPRNTEGPFVAINRASGSPLWLDKFSLPAYNEVVLGRTGSGKTFMAGLRAYRERLFGVQTVFLDPQGSFRRVTEAVGGRYNFLRLGEGTALNILDVVHEHPAAQVSHVVVLLESLLGRALTLGEKAVVDRALLDLYAPLDPNRYDPDEMPLLEDLALALLDAAPTLADDLERFVSGSLSGIFNTPTTLSLDLDRRWPIVTFDLSDLEGEFQPTFLFALLSSVERVIRHRRGKQQPTNIVVDEFGILSEIPVLWGLAGLLPLLLASCLLLLVFGYLALPAGGGDLTRWQLRYHLRSGDDLNRLEEVLRYLAAQTGHLVVEASAQGLVLELPPAFDRYVEAHLPQALPELRLTRVGQGDEGAARGSSFFCLGAPSSDALRWATEGEGRQVRLHVHQGPYATLIARTDGVRPLGRWLRIPRSLGQRLPVWDELSAGVPLSCLFPATDESAVYASRSRLLDLAPPDDYTPDLAGRSLGLSTAGRPLTLGRDLPLLTVGAPPSFLVRQALDDLQSGRTVVVVSPQRRVLERIAQQVGKTAVHWLDPQDSRKSARLAIVTAEEWAATDVETLVQLLQAFIAQLGLDVHLPFVGDFTRRLLRVLAEFARRTGQDLAFTDLNAVSQNTQAWRAFLSHVPDELAQELRAQLDNQGGYVQAVTILAAVRAALKPLEAGPLYALCQPPFLDVSQALAGGSLLLAPMTNADFPEHDRLLSAMLDLTLNRVLAANSDLYLALHLHAPHLYRDDEGQHWLDVARRDARLSLLLDVQESDRFVLPEGGQVIFRCSEALAASIIGEWNLPASVADLTELPTDTAIAHLPGMVVTLKAGEA